MTGLGGVRNPSQQMSISFDLQVFSESSGWSPVINQSRREVSSSIPHLVLSTPGRAQHSIKAVIDHFNQTATSIKVRTEAESYLVVPIQQMWYA